MGTCLSTEDVPMSPEEKAASKQIDSDLRKQKVQNDEQIKLLLLGAGESGKSTIFKQMKILHQNGYTKAELERHAKDIYSNIIKLCHTLINQARKFCLDLGDFEDDADDLLLLNSRDEIDDEIGNKIKQLAQHPATAAVIKRSHEFHLPDSSPYFLEHISRILSPNFIPTEQDVLRVRVKTTGIVETQWTINENLFKMYDVGGQRNERRKWIHHFDNVTAVIFVASLSGYNQVLEEDGRTNRMQEALTLFDQICNSRYFGSTSMILFLNKIDLFKEKISKFPLNLCFPNYPGDEGEDPVTAASDFIEQQFRAVNRNSDRQMYVHKTCATNTDNIKFVFDAVRHTIIQESIKASGF